MIPPNLRFLLDDAEDDWHYPEKFCLIHSRMMLGSITDWPALVRKSFQQLRPGGYLEFQDVGKILSDDNSFTLDPPSCDLARWFLAVAEAFDVLGQSILIAPDHKARLIDAGFTDVTMLEFKWPIGEWPRDPFFKEIGFWNRVNTLCVLESLALAPLTRALGWSMDRVQQLLEGARRDIYNRSIHAYLQV
jgi:SAM-dependent methyltransferase